VFVIAFSLIAVAMFLYKMQKRGDRLQANFYFFNTGIKTVITSFKNDMGSVVRLLGWLLLFIPE
jgi:hypothetical protein